MNLKFRSGYICTFLGVSAIALLFVISTRQRVVTISEDLINNTKALQVVKDRNYKTKILDIINCTDITLETSVQQRGKFTVFQNYIIADRQFKCEESVTLTSPGDYRFLDNVIPLVERWKGPISVALYAPGDDFFTTLQCIAYLRTCTTPLIREYVTFHLFFENKHMPEKDNQPLIDVYEDIFDCSEKPPYETKTDADMYKEKQKLTYPINVARNVAKVTAQTYFVFPSDIELYPTRNFIEKFLNFVKEHPEHVEADKNNVFVLPIFEVLADQKVPENKTHLQTMIDEKKAILFHQNVCAPCHRVPNGDKWIKAPETEGLEIFSVGKREGPQLVWEPFFVCTQKEPLWDERLNWEGQGNKMCQAYTMCILGYDFMVFDNAFLIHKPGIKKKKVQVLKHKDETKKNSKILLDVQREVQNIYGKNKKCKVHNV